MNDGLHLDEEEDEETLSSSSTGRLWKFAFSRPHGTQFLDICLLKKAYMKALEDMSEDEEEEEEEDTEAISSIINTLVDQIDDEDDVGLAQRIGKRSLTTSTMSFENEIQQVKRIRGNTSV